jgi:hypothetical protein
LEGIPFSDRKTAEKSIPGNKVPFTSGSLDLVEIAFSDGQNSKKEPSRTQVPMSRGYHDPAKEKQMGSSEAWYPLIRGFMIRNES